MIKNFFFSGFPPKFVEKPEKLFVLHGTKATFAAAVDGYPMPMIKWIKNGAILKRSEEMDVFYDETNDTHFLEIFEAKSKDAGQYKCIASNIFGSEIVPVILNVTLNKEEVVVIEDIRVKLKSRPPRPKVFVEEDVSPDWSTMPLKRAGPSRKIVEEDEWEIPKLKHWEIEKTTEEPIEKKETTSVNMN